MLGETGSESSQTTTSTMEPSLRTSLVRASKVAFIYCMIAIYAGIVHWGRHGHAAGRAAGQDKGFQGTSRLLEHRDQQCMLRSLERIEHRHASSGKSVLEILAEEQAALLIGGHGKDQRVPDRRLVVRREIKRCAQRVEGGVGDIECMGPTQNDGPRFCRRIARLADEYPVKLPSVCAKTTTRCPGRRATTFRAALQRFASPTPSA